MNESSRSLALVAVLATPLVAQDAVEASAESPIFAAPTRLMADGEPIQVGAFSRIAHAGPWIADIDGDGDRDLLVGDFPGYFWHFENTGDDKRPVYKSKGKLRAGSAVAKTPVY